MTIEQRAKCRNHLAKAMITAYYAYSNIRYQLISTLPKAHLFAYELAQDHEITTNELALELDIKLNHAGNILNELYAWALLNRRRIETSEGDMYVYTPTPEGNVVRERE